MDKEDAVLIEMKPWKKGTTPAPAMQMSGFVPIDKPVLALPAPKSTQVTLPPNPPPNLSAIAAIAAMPVKAVARVEVPQSKKLTGGVVKDSHPSFHPGVGPYRIARLAQYVNSRLHYGWTGSHAEQRHCKDWNLKPVPVQQ